MVEFFRSTDPVRAYFTALQSYLEVPQTGVWDLATHDAFWDMVRRIDPDDAPSSTPWGVTPARYNYTQSGMLDEIAGPEMFHMFQALLSALGIPSAKYEDFQLYTASLSETEKAVMIKVLDAVEEAIKTAESNPSAGGGGTSNGKPPPEDGGGTGTGTGTETTLTPSGSKFPTWGKVLLVAGGVAVAGGFVYWLMQQKKRRELDALGELGDGSCGCGG